VDTLFLEDEFFGESDPLPCSRDSHQVRQRQAEFAGIDEGGGGFLVRVLQELIEGGKIPDIRVANSGMTTRAATPLSG
jgi:hypothetical protein